MWSDYCLDELAAGFFCSDVDFFSPAAVFFSSDPGSPSFASPSGEDSSEGLLSKYSTIIEILRLDGSSGASLLRNLWSANPRTCVT